MLPDEVLRWNIDESLVLPISDFPARYPLPDLSLWRANKDFGFDSTGNIDFDMKFNEEIIQKRWDGLPARPIQEVSIWLPDLDDEPVAPVNTNHRVPVAAAASRFKDVHNSSAVLSIDEIYTDADVEISTSSSEKDFLD